MVSQATFASGEIAPSLYSRSDVAKYYSALAQCVNFVVMRQGGVENRPGTMLCDVALSESARLIPFTFSESQSLALVFGGGKIRFFYQGAPVVKDGEPYEIRSPYTDAQLKDIDYVQSADTMFLAHPEVPLKRLVRRGNTDWSIGNYNPEKGPFEDVNTEGEYRVYVEVEDEDTKTVLVHSIDRAGNPHDIFTQDDMESLFYIEQLDFSDLKPWISASKVAVGDIRYSDFKVYRCTQTPDGDFVTGPNKPTHESGALWDGDQDERDGKKYGVKWQYLHSTRMYCWLQEMVSPSVARAVAWHPGIIDTVVGQKNATYKWAHSAFSVRNGYPSCVTFYQQRLVLSGTKNQPQTIWMSGTNQYKYFGTSSPAVDSDAITFTLASGRMNKVTGFVPLKALVVLTEGAEWAIASQEGGLSARTLMAETQGNRGAAPMRPLSIGDSAVYVQAKRAGVRELGYSFQSDNYTGAEISILSHHLFDGKQIVDWAYQQSPNSTSYIVLDDGSVVMMTYFKEQEVIGFSRFVTDGKVTSVCSVPEDGYDAVYLIVKRKNGTLIERLENRRSPSNSFTDATLSYQGAPATQFFGLSHLEGQCVAVVIPGRETVYRTVQDGKVSIETPTEQASIGLPYDALLETLDIASDQSPDFVTKKKILSRAYIRCLDTKSIQVGANDGTLLTPKRLPWSEGQHAGTTMFEVNLLDKYRRCGRMLIKQADQIPTTVLSINLGLSAAG